MEDWKRYLIHIGQAIEDATLLIEENKGAAACVVDDRGVLRGIVTRADLEAGHFETMASLEDVMNPHPKRLRITESETDILDYMLRHNIRQLPLIDAKGVVRDIKYIDEHDIHWVMRPDQVKAAVLDGFVRGDPERERIVFLGDELAGFCEWTEFIHYPRIRLYNRGVFGNTIRDVRNRLESVLCLRPDRIFLMIGIHDLIRKKAPQDIFDDYIALVRAIRRMWETRMYVHSVLSVRDADTIRERERNVVELNDMLRTWAEPQHIPYIDLYSLLYGKEYRCTVDGWHLNAAGYGLWVSLIDRYLRN